MKHIFSISFFIISMMVMCAQEDKLQMSETDLTILPTSGINLKEINLTRDSKKNAAGEYIRPMRHFGPVYIWTPKNGEEIQVNNDLTALNKLCSDFLERERKQGFDRAAIYVATSIVTLYNRRGYRSLMILPPAGHYRQQYLELLKKEMPDEKYNKYVPFLKEAEIVDTKTGWRISFPVVTKLGGIEQHSFHGSSDPFCIKKAEVEMMAPAGTIPYVNFIPKLLDD